MDDSQGAPMPMGHDENKPMTDMPDEGAAPAAPAGDGAPAGDMPAEGGEEAPAAPAAPAEEERKGW